MRLDAVRAYTQDLGVQAFEFLKVFLESLQLPCSDRCKVGKIENKNHIFLAPVILKPDFALG
jgi:hypothetical protein